MKNNEIDYLVIGSGASGAAFSWKLSKNGAKVLCLEQGEFIDPNSYPKNKNHLEIAALTEWNWNSNFRDNKFDYPINNQNTPIQPLMFNAVGGSTIHYTAHTPRFHPSDFKVRTLDGVAEDWPINYFNLEKYYDENDIMMGCSGIAGDPANPPRTKRSYPPVPLGNDGEMIAKAFDSMNWHWWPSDNYVNSNYFTNKWDFIGSHALMDRPSVSSTDNKYWPEAIKYGAKIVTGARVKKILTNNQKRAIGVEYIKDGKVNFIKANNVVLACNAIGTARLLLMSSSENHQNGLGNSSKLIGKNLMFHPYAFIRGSFEGDNKFYNGPTANILMSQQFYETDKSRGFDRGFSLQMVRNHGPALTALELDWGENHHKQFSESFGNILGFSIIAEDLPEEKNYVSLNNNIKDSDGLPGVNIYYTLSENSRKILDFAINKTDKVLKEAGAKFTFNTPLMRQAGWHLMGTTKMGDNPRNSVTDKYGKMHDMENIYIIDGSLFVTSASVNPTPTIQALALMIADNLLKNGK